MRGSHSARTQDNFLTCDGKFLATAFHFDTNGFTPSKMMRCTMQSGLIVRFQPTGLAQIAQGGTPANAALLQVLARCQ